MTTEPVEPAPLDVVGLLLRKWRVVLACAALGAAGGVAYALLAPEWFEARLAVVPSQRSQDSAAMSLAAKLPVGIDSLATDVQRIKAVLTSVSVTDEVIEKFNLQKHYGTPFREHARGALWQHCATSVDRKSGVVTLTCEDQNPEFAREMTAYFGEVGNRVFGRVSASSAREERKFLETQVVKARKDVDEASSKLREFQERHKIVDLPEQSKAVISAMASIQGEMLSKQLELSYLTSFSSRTEASVVQLQQQIAIMEAKLKALESSQLTVPRPAVGSGSGSATGSASFFPDAMRVPELRYELEQLMREQQIRETVFALMTQRFEMAKVDEARDTSTFQILDYPTVPTFRSRPKRRRIALFGICAGLALGAIVVLAPAWWRRRTLR